MKYDEYAEYQVGNGGSCDYLCLCADSGIVLQEFALHIDIDTSMCGFTETDVPQYVANLMWWRSRWRKKLWTACRPYAVLP